MAPLAITAESIMNHDRTASYHRDQHVEEVLAGYLEAARAGQAPDRRELLTRHPELASDLQDFFADHDLVRNWAEPLRCDAAAVHTPPAAAADTATLVADRLPSRFGDYELLGEIARGGMGVVYRARQLSLNRIVALKWIEPGGRAPEEIERFLHTEAQAVASLDHPHIVPIYEAGTHEGRPFFSMKLIDGGNLTQKMRHAKPLSQRRAAQLLAAVARAVHHAHQRGILHRDLKPSNVLLDQAGQPHVTDFGLARRVEADSAVSQGGNISGTPSYMAPEQADSGKRQTTAVDVYGLGAVLYELLTGQPPFRAATPLDTLLQVRTQEPPRPRALHTKIDRDLETICLKCLEKDPARRYGSAEAVADDLEHWLAGEPIRARRTGSWQRAVLWARRRPAAAAFAAAILCLCLGLFGFALWGWQNAVRAEQAAAGRARAEEKARQAADQEARALEKARLLEVARADAEARKTKLVEAHLALERAMNHCQRDEVTEGLLWLARGLEVVPDDETELRLSFRRLLAGWSQDLNQLKQMLPITNDGDVEPALSPNGKVFATSYHYALDKPPGIRLADAVTGKPLGQPIHPRGTPIHLAFSPDGTLLAIVCHNEVTKVGSVDFWDTFTQQPVGEPMLLSKATTARQVVQEIAFSPDGKRLVTLDDWNSYDFGARLWEVPTGKPVRDPLPTSNVRTAVFSPDGKVLLTVGGDLSEARAVHLWDAGTGKALGELAKQTYPVNSAAFSRDGKTFVTAGFRPGTEKPAGLVQVFDTATGKGVSKGAELPREAHRVAFGPDGKTILVRTHGSTFHLFRLRPNLRLEQIGRPVPAPRSSWQSFAFSPDGKAVWLINDRYQAQPWDTFTGAPLGNLIGGVSWVGFDKDATLLTTNGADVRRWSIGRALVGRKLDFPEEGLYFSAAFSPDGNNLALAVLGEKAWGVWFWDRAAAKPAGLPIVANNPVTYVAYSPDGKLLLTDDGDANAYNLWDTATNKRVASIPVGGDFWRRRWAKVAISSDSKWVLAADGQVAQLYEAWTGKPTGKRFEHGDTIWAVALSPDGKRVLTGGDKQAARLWDAETGQPIGPVLKHSAAVSFVAFSPDGKRALTSGLDTAKLWDAETGQPLGQPILHANRDYQPLHFSPDSTSILAVGRKLGSARLWDAATGQPQGRYLEHPVSALAFSPDGKMIVLAGAGGMQVWDVATGRPVGKPLWKLASGAGDNNEIGSVVFSPDSRTLLA
jgi:WD40 repeat protein